MKYVIFSFDDGLLDFKTNALPILEKYGFKATINIISGYIDKTHNDGYEYLNINDINDLHKKGFEIANHTDTHFKYGSYCELKTCEEKIQSWINKSDSLGIAMPFYKKPSKDAKRFIKKNRSLYVTYESRQIFGGLFSFISILYSKIKFSIKKDILSQYKYAIRLRAYKHKKKKKLFHRIAIGRNTNVDILFNSLSVLKKNECITMCFHSVTDSPESCPFPNGSISLANFDKLCKLVASNEEMVVVTQKDVFSK